MSAREIDPNVSEEERAAPAVDEAVSSASEETAHPAAGPRDRRLVGDAGSVPQGGRR